MKEIQLTIFDSKCETVKVIDLPYAAKNMNLAIPITDLPFGNYFYTITKKNKELHNGTFVRDWFDADLIN